jgi:Xaa-Pro aminopeptidase
MKNTIYAKRRKKLLSQMQDGVALVPSASLQMRSNDTEFPFRQESNFYYLSGFNEPDALLLLCKNKKSSKTVLFLRKRDPQAEMWVGKRLGVEEACAVLGVDEAYDIETLEEKLSELLEGHLNLYLDTFSSNSYLRQAKKTAEKLSHTRNIERSPRNFIHLNPLLEKMRLHKEPYETEQIRKALSITRQAHHAAMAAARPGMKEYEIQALIEYIFKKEGSPHDAYGTIVAGGNNANTLHYIENSKALKNGELMLIDAGCEWENYASDITRTSPVNGKFSAHQQALYEGILDAQLKIIKAVKPGISKQKLQVKSELLLTEVMQELGILKGSLDELIEKKSFKKYYPHGIGHWMGLDVHDTCPYKDENGKDILFEEGMVLTIEPAIYLPLDDMEIPEAFRGIGIRTEDDILLTSKGYENLSLDIAKSVDEIEKICAMDYREFI